MHIGNGEVSISAPGLLGAEDLDALVPEEARAVPEDSTLVLFGDAKAFWYQRPMSRLRYRTVFDVDTSGTSSVIDAWTAGLPLPDPPHCVRLVHPAELTRFSRTYWMIPPLPATLRARGDGPFILP